MIGKFSDDFITKIKTWISEFSNIKDLNRFLENKTGIIDFFKSTTQIEDFKQFLDKSDFTDTVQDMGDFQTPIPLADKICKLLADAGFAPDVVIEPTCGEGNFILSAIRSFPTLKYIYCVDVQSF